MLSKKKKKKKPVINGHIKYDSIGEVHKQNYRYIKEISSCLGLVGRWRGQLISKGYSVSFWGGEHVLKLTTVIVAHICEYIKKHRVMYFKWMHCDLNLNKAIFKSYSGEFYF